MPKRWKEILVGRPRSPVSTRCARRAAPVRKVWPVHHVTGTFLVIVAVRPAESVMVKRTTHVPTLENVCDGF